MTDITYRLLCMGYEEAVCDPAVMEEAAYEIVQLRAERDRLREALRGVVAAYPLDKFKDNGMRVSAHLEANAALGDDRA